MTFKKGQSGNPSGKTRGQQDYVTRARHLLNTMTVMQIMEMVAALRLCASLKAPDRKQHPKEYALYLKAAKMPARDMAIMMTIADAFRDGKNFNILLDRILGKPTLSVQMDQTLNADVTTTSAGDPRLLQEFDRWLEATERAKSKISPPSSLPH